MQHTHDIDDDRYEWPENLAVKDVNVYVHPSGMLMTHDYSCPICRENHAMLSGGVMTPCWECREKGWITKKEKQSPSMLERIIAAIFDSSES